MRALFITLSLNIYCLPVTGQSLFNNQRAIEIIDKSISVIGKCPESLKISGKGIMQNLGHYETPGKTIEIPVEEAISFFPNQGVAILRSVIERNKNTFVNSMICKGDSIYSIGYNDRTYSKKKNYDGLVRVAKASPVWFLYLARQNSASLRMTGKTKHAFLVTVSMPDEQTYTLVISKKSHLLTKIERIGYDNIYGNTIYVTEYKNYKVDNGIQIPANRLDYEYGRVEREIKYDSYNFKTLPDTSHYRLKWLPSAFITKLTEDNDGKEKIVFEAISDNIDLIKIESQNNKSLLVKLQDAMALFEVPQGIKLNQQLIHEIQERYPQTTIKYLFLTHHHPDHAGGIKAYSNLNAKVITTEGNKAYFGKLLKANHNLLQTESSNNSFLEFDFVPIGGQKEFRNVVRAYEIGENTGHTNEHLVFYFLNEKILWTGDLLFFYEGDRVYPAGKRGRSVYDLITNKKLEVKRIYTSWPLHGQKSFGTVEFLKKLTEAK